MSDSDTYVDVGVSWNPMRFPPRVGDVFRAKLGSDEVELLCFDPTWRSERQNILGAWRVGYGEHEVISAAALIELYYPVARGDVATPATDLEAFAEWWICHEKIVYATEAKKGSLAAVVIASARTEADVNRPAYEQVRRAIEAIAAYEKARGIKADYSRSDHVHCVPETATPVRHEYTGQPSAGDPAAYRSIWSAAGHVKPGINFGATDNTKAESQVIHETATLHVGTTDALPEWAKPGQKVGCFGPERQKYFCPGGPIRLEVLAIDHGRILIGERKRDRLVGGPFAVCAPDFDGWWPVDERGNPLVAEPRKIGDDRSGGVARTGDAVSVNREDFKHPPEAIAKAGDLAASKAAMVDMATANTRAYLQADIATLERMLAEPWRDVFSRMGLEGRLKEARKELASLDSKGHAVDVDPRTQEQVDREDLTWVNRILCGSELLDPLARAALQAQRVELMAKLAALKDVELDARAKASHRELRRGDE